MLEELLFPVSYFLSFYTTLIFQLSSFYFYLYNLSFSFFYDVQIDTRMTMHGMARRLICI